MKKLVSEEVQDEVYRTNIVFKGIYSLGNWLEEKNSQARAQRTISAQLQFLRTAKDNGLYHHVISAIYQKKFIGNAKDEAGEILAEACNGLRKDGVLEQLTDLTVFTMIRKKLAYDFNGQVDPPITLLYCSDNFLTRVQSEEVSLQLKCDGLTNNQAEILKYLAEENDFCEILCHAKEYRAREDRAPIETLIVSSVERLRAAAAMLTPEQLQEALADKFDPEKGEFKKAGGVLKEINKQRTPNDTENYENII